MNIFYIILKKSLCYYLGDNGIPWWLRGKESACNAGDMGFISGSERSPGEENGNPLQYSCLENSMDRGGWWAIVHRVAKEADDLVSKQQRKNTYYELICFLFVLLTMFCTEKKFLSFMKLSLSIFSFMDPAFAILSKKSSPKPGSSRFSLVLSSRGLIGLHFTIYVYVLFCVNFLWRLRSVSIFNFLHVNV